MLLCCCSLPGAVVPPERKSPLLLQVQRPVVRTSRYSIIFTHQRQVFSHFLRHRLTTSYQCCESRSGWIRNFSWIRIRNYWFGSESRPKLKKKINNQNCSFFALIVQRREQFKNRVARAAHFWHFRLRANSDSVSDSDSYTPTLKHVILLKSNVL